MNLREDLDQGIEGGDRGHETGVVGQGIRPADEILQKLIYTFSVDLNFLEVIMRDS